MDFAPLIRSWESDLLAARRCLADADIRDACTIFGSARLRPDSLLGRRWLPVAESLGASLATWMQREHPSWVLCTGGGPGVMEAASRGAAQAGARVLGLNIQTPWEQHPNPWIGPGLSLHFQDFATRKAVFFALTRALAVFPGGLGTMDELFEVLTLQLTGSLPAFPIVLMDTAHWERLLPLDYLEANELLDTPKNLLVTDSEAEAMNWLTRRR